MPVQHGPGPDGESQIGNQRRFALLQAYLYLNEGAMGLAGTLFAQHRGMAGTPLPANFPARAKFIVANYSAVEDIDGAGVDELTSNVANLTTNEAAAAIRALGYTP